MDDADPTRPPVATPGLPRLRLRGTASQLLELPWQLPLAEWPADDLVFRALPVGPSRHLVRFLVDGGRTYALKEEPLAVARREFETLRALEARAMPAVAAVGLAELPERDTAILVTDYLEHSLQYRLLLMRLPAGPSGHRDRLLDAMAWLLVDLHRGGLFWGDCSLTNTLFRRDGDRIQAYLVDAETSELHPTLTTGQRLHDLDILVENIGYGLADLLLLADPAADVDQAVAEADSVRDRYLALWDRLHERPELLPDDQHAIRTRIRQLNELGFTVDEIGLEPSASGPRLRLELAVTTRRFHARRLERTTGIRALENQARLLLNDMREWGACQVHQRGPIDDEALARQWLRAVYRPATQRIAEVAGSARDLVQAYCDLLEHKWLLSERIGQDVGLDAALDCYLALGAPAPEDAEAA